MTIPAQQLRSAALRFQRPLDPPSARDPFARPSRSPAKSAAGIAAASLSVGSGTTIAGQMARRARLEAILLLAREPLSLRKLAQSANLTDGTEARTLLTHLRQCYDARRSAFQVEQVAGGYQLMTRPEFAPWLRPRLPREQETRLSPPAQETLAVVAYRQPILRAEVEAIRGVACGEILRQLMDRDLLRIVGRSEELGRPLWYGTTKRFLQVYGLRDLDQLPLAERLRRMGPTEYSNASAASTTPPRQHDATGATGAAEAA